jgi:hypothetical protein
MTKSPRPDATAEKSSPAWPDRPMHIQITKDAINGFRVRAVDADGRRVARARTLAYGNCPIQQDPSGAKERRYAALDHLQARKSC